MTRGSSRKKDRGVAVKCAEEETTLVADDNEEQKAEDSHRVHREQQRREPLKSVDLSCLRLISKILLHGDSVIIVI
ncbi:hypothetical protein SUGI_0772060 [Cryptomeria japonica]|nr:hypothetical protein SUGI_0772060 [Cryptomeria japonica]